MALTVGSGGGAPITSTSTAPTKPATDPTASTDPASQASGDQHRKLPETYTVKSGDTLGEISARFKVPLATLKDLNPKIFSSDPGRSKDGHWIYPGDVIRLRPKQADGKGAGGTVGDVASKAKVAAAKKTIDGIMEMGSPTSKDLEQAKKALDEIPADDPQHGTYAGAVKELGATVDKGGSTARDPKAEFQQTFDEIQKLDPKAQDYPAKLIDLADKATGLIANNPTLAEDHQVRQELDQITQKVGDLANSSSSTGSNGQDPKTEFQANYDAIQKLDPKAADYPAKLVDLADKETGLLANNPDLATDDTVRQEMQDITRKVGALAGDGGSTTSPSATTGSTGSTASSTAPTTTAGARTDFDSVYQSFKALDSGASDYSTQLAVLLDRATNDINVLTKDPTFFSDPEFPTIKDEFDQMVAAANTASPTSTPSTANK